MPQGEDTDMGCRRGRRKKRKNKKTCGGLPLGMILIAAGVVILSFFVLPHKVLIIVGALALIVIGCFLA